MTNDRQPPDDADNDDELELEPIDPEILDHERRRAAEKTHRALNKVDVDELLREREGRDLEIDPNLFRQFRFTTRHLLVATALLSVVMAMSSRLGGCMTLFVLGVTAVASGWIGVTLLERRREAERQRRRAAILAGTGPPSGDASTDTPPPAALSAAPSEAPFKIRWSFSTQQMLIAVTAAGVLFGLLQWAGPEHLALVMGLAALAGLVVNALGFDPPAVVVLGWWILLAVYLIFGFIAAFT